MKRSAQKIRNARQEFTRRLRVPGRAASKAVPKSIRRWVDRSKDVIGTLPTFGELRDEFADWRSFDPISPADLEPA